MHKDITRGIRGRVLFLIVFSGLKDEIRIRGQVLFLIVFSGLKDEMLEGLRGQVFLLIVFSGFKGRTTNKGRTNITN